MLIRFAVAAFATLIFVISNVARGEDLPTTEIKPGDVAVDSAIQEIVKQLNAKKKDDREAAAAKVKEAGAAAIPALEETALQGKRESIIRAIDILNGFAQSPDPALQAKAIEAMQRLAKSKSPIAVRRVKDLLQDMNPNIGQGLNGAAIRQGGGIGGFAFGGFNGGGGDGTGEGKGKFGIVVGNPPGSKVKKYKMEGNGNERDIEVEEQARTIKIHIDPQGPIKIEITEMKDGKPTSRTVEAKDAADLKQKDAGAFKDFEEYSKPPNGVHVGPIPGGIGPGVPIPLEAGDADPEARKSLEMSVKELEKAIDTIRKAPQVPKELKPLQIEVLQQQVRVIREQIRKMEQAERTKNREQKNEKE